MRDLEDKLMFLEQDEQRNEGRKVGATIHIHTYTHTHIHIHNSYIMFVGDSHLDGWCLRHDALRTHERLPTGARAW